MDLKIHFALAAFVFAVAVSVPAAAGQFKLYDGKSAADIVVDAGDYKVVRIAGDAFAGDVQLVTGVKPSVKTAPDKKTKRAVIIGTIEKSAVIKKLIGAKKIDVSKIRGKWETFIIVSVAKPLPGVESALVVAGSDRRAAAFGAFEVSQRIGVSPWVWWADASHGRARART